MKNRMSGGFRLLFLLYVLSGFCLIGEFKLPQSWARIENEEEYCKTHLKSAMRQDWTFLGDTSKLWARALEETLPVKGIKEADRATVVKIYEQRRWQPLFINPHFELSKEGRKLIHRLEGIEDDAIDPGPYKLSELRKSLHRLDQLCFDTRSLNLASQELGSELRRAKKSKDHQLYADLGGLSLLVEHAKHLSNSESLSSTLLQKMEDYSKELFREAGRIDTQLTVNLIRLAQEMHPNSSAEVRIQPLLDERTAIVDFLESLEPAPPRYTTLRHAFKRYRDLALNKPQKKLYFTHSLRKGESGNSIRLLQERLREEGFYEHKVHGRFDDATVEAVRRFQKHHLLEPDGVVGAKTLEQLNVPFADKAQMIAYSLELLRRSHTHAYDRFVRINIPQFTLEYYNEGQLKAVHRVIVGKSSKKDQTPSFVSAIERVVFNPNWYVSERIRLELGELDYKRGYFQMSSLYSWGEPRIAQLPGPTNPLGKVKFEFPNPYAVFVHDTPNKHLFSKSQRSLSHGCIRLENALDFAQMLLADDQNLSADKIDVYTARKSQTFVKLNQPVPIILEYLPVSVDENREILFCGDPYSHSKNIVKKSPEIWFTSPVEKERQQSEKISDV